MDGQTEAPFHNLFQAIESVKDVEPAYNAARLHVHEEVLRLSQMIDNDQDQRERTIGYLYWFEPYVSLDSISEAFGVKDVKKIANAAYPDIQCTQCGHPLINPRNKVQRRSLVCTSCDRINRTAQTEEEKASRQIKAHREWRKRERKAEQLERAWEYTIARRQQAETDKAIRLQELRAMPYQDYLQTPEWGKTRGAALRRSNYRCQVCNTNKRTLDVHHRTYERLGHEHYTDLLVLCRECHGTFHKNGKLAK